MIAERVVTDVVTVSIAEVVMVAALRTLRCLPREIHLMAMNEPLYL